MRESSQQLQLRRSCNAHEGDRCVGEVVESELASAEGMDKQRASGGSFSLANVGNKIDVWLEVEREFRRFAGGTISRVEFVQPRSVFLPYCFVPLKLQKSKLIILHGLLSA